MTTFRENNITPMYVRNMYAMYRDLPFECLSVADLVCLAKTGGTAISGRTASEKAAFSIAEIGGSTGKLLAGARPFWNIFAANSPGLWDLAGTIDSGIYTLEFFLKTFPNRTDYGCRLDSFSLHNLDATEISTKTSADGYTPIATIDMGYNDDKQSFLNIYPCVGELNYTDIFTRASFTWLTDPYFKIREIIKGGSNINIANEAETGHLSFAESSGVENGGGYIVANINTSTLYVGSNSCNVRLNVGNGTTVSNPFCINNFDVTLNLTVKERVHFSDEYITIFGSGATETTTLDLLNLYQKIRPSDAETFVNKFPPYVGARYTITANLQMLITRAGVEAYITKVAVTDEGDLNQAVTDGNAFKIANLTYYDYVSPSYLYPISYNGTFPTAIIDDTYTLVILIVSNVE